MKLTETRPDQSGVIRKIGGDAHFMNRSLRSVLRKERPSRPSATTEKCRCSCICERH